jgi:hypothetical protein
VPWGGGSRPHARLSRVKAWAPRVARRGGVRRRCHRSGGAGRCGQPACVRRVARGEWVWMAVRRGGPTTRGSMGAVRPRRAVRRRARRPVWRPRRDAACIGTRSVAGSAGSISIIPFPLCKTPYFLTVVVRVINNKDVDLLFLYNFHKRCMAFFSSFCAQI